MGINGMAYKKARRNTDFPVMLPTPQPTSIQNPTEKVSEKVEEKVEEKVKEEIPKKVVNVVISAYDCVNYIEECLNSIANQTYACKTIYLGIDGCDKTLEKVKSIMYNYTNLKVYYASKNSGPYAVLNSLIELIPDDEYFITFGADDIMNNHMVASLSNFDEPAVSPYDGVIFVKKSTFKQIGGYRNWRCAADSDVVFRLNCVKPIVRTPLYYQYRKHEHQLTNDSNTDFTSNLRKGYIDIIQANRNAKIPTIYIEPIGNPIVLINKKVSVNIATYPARKNEFIKTVEAIVSTGMVDIIRVYLNEYTEIPEDFPISRKIIYLMDKDNLKDSGKLYWADTYKDEYYFACDDDIIYTRDYFINHIKALDVHNTMVVTTHGQIIPSNPKEFGDSIQTFKCTVVNKCDEWVMVPGSGVLAFDNSKFKIPNNYIKYHGMCDLWVALFCQENQIPVKCRAHKNNEVISILGPNHEDTLWVRRHEMDNEHNLILNKITWQLYTPSKIIKLTNKPKYKIAIVTGVWGRPEITEYVYAYYTKMAEDLKDIAKIKIFVAGSEGKASSKLAEKYNVEYVEADNSPLSQKFNAASLLAKKWNPDGAIYIGSDDLISYNLLKFYTDYLMLGNTNPFGVTDGYFVWDDKIGYWGGYTNHRVGESLGAGRFYPKYALDKIGWKVWGDARIDSSLDAASTKVLLDNDLIMKTGRLVDLNAYVACLQSQTKLTHQLLGMKDTFEPATIVEDCINEFEILKLLETEKHNNNVKEKLNAMNKPTDLYNNDFINIDGNEVHNTAIINDNVILGKGNRIGAYSVIGSNGEIRNVDPHDFKGKIIIGDHNVISEHVTIQTPFEEGTETRIGDNNIIMAHAHIGHDAKVGSNTEICTTSIIGGYATVKDGAKIKLGCIIRNRITVGENALVGMGSVVISDVPDNAIVYGNPAKEKK